MGEPMHEHELSSPAAELQKLRDELAETKRADVAAKRAGRFEDRAAIGRAIYDLMRRIAAMKGADLG
jgi:hypothetical protein